MCGSTLLFDSNRLVLGSLYINFHELKRLVSITAETLSFVQFLCWQTAIKMYKLAGEERFLLWAVCSIQLQVSSMQPHPCNSFSF